MQFRLFHICFIILLALRVIFTCSGGGEDCLSNDKEKIKKISDQKVLVSLRRNLKDKVNGSMPSPHSELLLGVTLGLNDLSKVRRFNDVVRDIGIIHVIVVSGFNINLLADMLLSSSANKFNNKKATICIVVLFFYSCLSGLNPPVVRAFFMFCISIFVSISGYRQNALYNLYLSCMLIILIFPGFMYSLGFQLSALASLGLIVFSDVDFALGEKTDGIFLKNDLKSTLAAQVLVWPLIAYHFGTVSVISPLANAVLLWIIPLVTVMGAAYLLLLVLLPFLQSISLPLLMILLDFFVEGSYFFGSMRLTSIEFNVSKSFLVTYYLLVIIYLLLNKIR